MGENSKIMQQYINIYCTLNKKRLFNLLHSICNSIYLIVKKYFMDYMRTKCTIFQCMLIFGMHMQNNGKKMRINLLIYFFLVNNSRLEMKVSPVYTYIYDYLNDKLLTLL